MTHKHLIYTVALRVSDRKASCNPRNKQKNPVYVTLARETSQEEKFLEAEHICKV